MKRKSELTDLEPACFYLRKSREDHEAEERGEGETLAKHRKALFKLAKECDVEITKVFEEIVSGESLIHRPEMLQLLKEIEAGQWKSVFCMDVDRLGRGGMQDQGLIIETFKQAKTKIVTPRKVYDLNDEFDEEYTEFEAFMARKELKIITRRLQNGRLRSVEDGNYLGTVPPFGYLIEKKDHKRYLVKNPEQQEPTKLIFKLYLNGNGTNRISNELNSLGYRSYTGKLWSGNSVLCILKNPVYAGITVWKKKEIKKSKDPNKKKDTRTRPRSDQIWITDTHEGYVTLAEFEKVQEILEKKYHPPYQLTNGLTNPLAGLIKCHFCGSSMVYRPYSKGKPHLMCYNKQCQNKSTRFDVVEEYLLKALSTWIENYQAEWEIIKPVMEEESVANIKEKVLQNLNKELQELNRQKDNIHNLLERGIYTLDIYLERYQKLSDRIQDTMQTISENEKIVKKEIKREKAQKNIIPRVKKVLAMYSKATNALEKNKMLKSIIEYAEYRKDKNQRGDEFTLVLYPKLPK